MSNIKNYTWEAEGYYDDYTGLYDPPRDTGCPHEYVNISFNHIVMACKHCGQDQPKENR